MISPEISQTAWAKAADQYQLAEASLLLAPLLQGPEVIKKRRSFHHLQYSTGLQQL